MTQGSTRRTVLATGAATLATACAGCSGQSKQTEKSEKSEKSESESSPSSGSAGTRDAKDEKELTRTSDVPVGGGLVLPDQKIVVTQPTRNVFKAFSAVCTHQGCTVNDVANGTIDCPCHGSQFHIADGSVAHGPATKPLPKEDIKVVGDSIRRV